MHVSPLRRSIVQIALVGLLSLGVAGGSLSSSALAAAMPRTRCEVFTDLSQFDLNQGNLMYGLGLYSLANPYYQRSINYNLAALAAC